MSSSRSQALRFRLDLPQPRKLSLSVRALTTSAINASSFPCPLCLLPNSTRYQWPDTFDILLSWEHSWFFYLCWLCLPPAITPSHPPSLPLSLCSLMGPIFPKPSKSQVVHLLSKWLHIAVQGSTAFSVLLTVTPIYRFDHLSSLCTHLISSDKKCVFPFSLKWRLTGRPRG